MKIDQNMEKWYEMKVFRIKAIRTKLFDLNLFKLSGKR